MCTYMVLRRTLISFIILAKSSQAFLTSRLTTEKTFAAWLGTFRPDLAHNFQRFFTRIFGFTNQEWPAPQRFDKDAAGSLKQPACNIGNILLQHVTRPEIHLHVCLHMEAANTALACPLLPPEKASTSTAAGGGKYRTHRRHGFCMTFKTEGTDRAFKVVELGGPNRSQRDLMDEERTHGSKKNFRWLGGVVRWTSLDLLQFQLWFEGLGPIVSIHRHGHSTNAIAHDWHFCEAPGTNLQAI